MLFYGGDFSLNTSSMAGIFVDYPRDNDGGSDGVNLFGSPNYLIIGYHWGSNTPHTSLAYGGFCSFTREVGLHTVASTNASYTYPEVCIRLSKN